MLRSFFLAPCLLICLACATPFPIDSLEVGMTKVNLREKFGEPEAIMTAWAAPELTGEISNSGADPGVYELSWTYVDENQVWPMLIFPQAILAMPVNAAIPDTPWDQWYVRRRQVLLFFEGEKLVRWNVGEFDWTPSSFGAGMNLGMDMQHHMMGHTHHHHGC